MPASRDHDARLIADISFAVEHRDIPEASVSNGGTKPLASWVTSGMISGMISDMMSVTVSIFNISYDIGYVILPLLEALRQWPHPVRLMKVKSHTGCLLNERADEQAELGYDDTAQ
jgi:hypothetical protein